MNLHFSYLCVNSNPEALRGHKVVAVRWHRFHHLLLSSSTCVQSPFIILSLYPPASLYPHTSLYPPASLYPLHPFIPLHLFNPLNPFTPCIPLSPWSYFIPLRGSVYRPIQSKGNLKLHLSMFVCFLLVCSIRSHEPVHRFASNFD